MEYSFTLKYQLAEETSDPEALVERLAEAGCDDALIGLGHSGRLALEFTREAECARAAVHGALTDVKQVIGSSRLIEATPDLVGLTDVAQIAGVSRQNMRKLMLAYPYSFPMPIHEGQVSIWHLAEVLAWLEAKGGYSLEPSLRETASVIMEVNLARESHSLTAKMVSELKALIA